MRSIYEDVPLSAVDSRLAFRVKVRFLSLFYAFVLTIGSNESLIAIPLHRIVRVSVHLDG